MSLLQCCETPSCSLEHGPGGQLNGTHMGDICATARFGHATHLVLISWDCHLGPGALPCFELGLSPSPRITQGGENELVGWAGIALPGHGCFQTHRLSPVSIVGLRCLPLCRAPSSK